MSHSDTQAPKDTILLIHQFSSNLNCMGMIKTKHGQVFSTLTISFFVMQLILIINCRQVIGQTQVIDSLRNALKTEHSDTNKVNTLNAISCAV